MSVKSRAGLRWMGVGLGLLSLVLALPSAAWAQVTYSGDSVGATGTNGGPAFDVLRLTLPAAGGSFSEVHPIASIPGGCIGNCTGIHPPGIELSVSGVGGTSATGTNVDYFEIVARGNTILGDWVMPRATASCPPSVSATGTFMGWLVINGVAVIADGGASGLNLVFPLPGGGVVRVNEVIASTTATSADITVNGIHILVPGGGEAPGPGTDVIIGQAHADVNNCGVGPSGCVRTQGYWKNHPEAWPVTSLTLGTVTYSQAQLLAILSQPTGGNGLVSLARQLIAARLNIASGASVPAAVAAALSQADSLINGLVIPPVGSGYLHPSVTSATTTILDAYNNGTAPGGPPHCN